MLRKKRLGLLLLAAILLFCTSVPAMADEGGEPIEISRFDLLEQTSSVINQGEDLPAFPQQITGYDSAENHYTLALTWSSDDYADVPGEYLFTAALSGGYTFAADLEAPTLLLTVVSVGRQAPTDRSALSASNQSLGTLSATSTVDTSLTDEEIVQMLVGENVIPFNISITGDASGIQRGVFSSAGDVLGIDSGVILSTGDARTTFSNTLMETGNYISTSLSEPGDADLQSHVGASATHDAAVIEFDFIPQTSLLSFDYVFASTEWDQDVNDAFALYVNGENRALLPTGSIISIEKILTDSQLPWPWYDSTSSSLAPQSQGYFVNTEQAGYFNFTGRSVLLTCTATVAVGELTHVKLVIADIDDRILDSALFIRANSIVTVVDVPTENVLPAIPLTGDTTSSAGFFAIAFCLVGLGFLVVGIRVRYLHQRRAEPAN